ncbi:MFS monosaccharide transporter [Rhodocollybia butyracea]|uniref:MFS monosaccharide transporter n=1 Tax=Rhodocollybia butyracea TaxID=206335 RepID=A0A9P5Q495_9AGAR|nr:MFS monosaccharide transporter [Rhodocollybia butyracea]
MTGPYARISDPHDSTNSSEAGRLLNGPVVYQAPHGGSISFQSNAYTYRYGPKGITGLTRNRYTLLCAVFASIGGLSFGYDQGVIANVLVMPEFMKNYPITPLEEGFMTAVLELGALLGAVFTGIFADHYSRRFSISVSCIVFCIGSTIQCSAQSLLHLLIGRAIGGLGVGALSTLCPLFISEISPPEVRGSLMALEQFAIVLGVVLGFWLGYLTRNIPGSASYIIPLAGQLIPGVILLLGCAFLPASPRLLVLQGKYDGAVKSLIRLRLGNMSFEEARNDPLIQIEFLEMRVEATMIHRAFGSTETSSKSAFFVNEWSSWKRLLGQKYRDRTMVGVLIAFFQQWSGINALLYYGPILVRSVGISAGKVTLLVSGGIGIVQFIAVLPVIAYIDEWGRRPLLRFGSIVMTCAHFGIAMLVVLFASDWTSHSTAAWMAVGFIYLFTAAYGMSFGPVAWVLPSEVFPLSVRSKGVALSTASVWLNNCKSYLLVGLITPVTLEYSAAGTFMLFAVASFVAYIWVTYCVPETANVSLEEIDGVFRSSAGREEIVMKSQASFLLLPPFYFPFSPPLPFLFLFLFPVFP